MAIELHLQKSTKTPWGFRLAGGVEYEVPLTVIKVTEGSIAENAGMQTGDVVVRINDIPTAGLTHAQAHDTLLNVGDDFVLAVRRGDLSQLPQQLLLYETSVENAEDVTNVEIFKPNDNENNDQDLNITDEEIANIIGEQIHLSSQNTVEKTSVEVTENVEEISVVQKQSEVAKVLLSAESQKLEEKKWSTFLQKPKNPKPKPKVKEPERPKGQPYRVVIKKQPKKEETVATETLIKNEEMLELETNSNEKTNVVDDANQSSSEDHASEVIQNEDQLDENENVAVKEIAEKDDGHEETDALVKDDEEPEENEIKEEICHEITRRESQSEKRMSINLEEQLAQVQQQLLALSQLPSAIQQTLNAVTQQLSEIVQAKQEISVEASATVEEEITAEYLEVSEHEHEEKALSVLEEESYEHYEEEIREETLECAATDSEDEQALFEALEKEIEEEERRNEEELEAQRIEQEKLEKKDKERRPSHPLTPLQRPIILPGGRKWSQPDDAILKVRRPSMTDEKIANTINTFSEVIVGHTMGINFLKYQPPPKNLDYLQRSAVYRLIHDIEPPAKGVIAREIKALAEQDYYSGKQEENPPLPQMER